MSQMTKAAVRAKAKKQRDGWPGVAQASRAVVERLMAQSEFRSAKTICCYVSFRSEVQTHDLIRKCLELNKTVCVPYCHSQRELRLFRIDSIDELEAQTMGILEPSQEIRNRSIRAANIRQVDLVIVPGLAFSQLGQRIGYGRGHYDRLLNAPNTAIRIGLAFECQIFDDLPTDEFDMTMDRIVTQTRIISIRAE